MESAKAQQAGVAATEGGAPTRPSQQGCAGRKQVKVTVCRDVADVFKDACAAADVSMASALSQFMTDYAGSAPAKPGPAAGYTTRRRRRAAIKKMIRQLVQIRNCEERYLDRIPENLQGSSISDAAEEFLSCIDEAIDALESTAAV